MILDFCQVVFHFFMLFPFFSVTACPPPPPSPFCVWGIPHCVNIPWFIHDAEVRVVFDENVPKYAWHQVWFLFLAIECANTMVFAITFTRLLRHLTSTGDGLLGRLAWSPGGR